MGESTRFMEYIKTTASVRYPLEKLCRTFLKLFWKTFEKTPLKKSFFNNDEDSRPRNFPKTQSCLLNRVTYVAYMLKIISLTGTVYSHEICENYFVCGWSKWMSFTCVQKLLYSLDFNYWTQRYKLFCLKKGTISRALSNI